MKKFYLIIFLMFFLVISIKAQDRNESHEKIKSLKIAYLTEQLALTSSEAENFGLFTILLIKNNTNYV